MSTGRSWFRNRFWVLVAVGLAVTPDMAQGLPPRKSADPFCIPSKLRIAVDVGHSRKQPGAVSARGVNEFEFNRQFSLVFLDALRRNGFAEPIRINADGDVRSLHERGAIARSRGAGLFVSIHHDSVQPRYLSKWQHEGKSRRYSDRFTGHSIFVSLRNGRADASLAFARAIGRRLRADGLGPTLHHAEKIPGENREFLDREAGVYRFDDLIVLKSAGMPAVLIEVGIIVNREEELRLSSKAYRARVADAIADGIVRGCAGPR